LYDCADDGAERDRYYRYYSDPFGYAETRTVAYGRRGLGEHDKFTF
jgi:hypothetical protein